MQAHTGAAEEELQDMNAELGAVGSSGNPPAESQDAALEPREEPSPKTEFDSVKQRLQEIADTVEDRELSLDEALDLYEEAVSLGLRASDLLEVGVHPEEADAEGDAPGDAPEDAVLGPAASGQQ